MAPLIFLLLGLLCGLIARILLVAAAFGISKKWGFGVFFPFGPLFFRLSFPEEARRARMFQLATLPCVFFYMILSPELLPSTRVGLARIGPPGHERLTLVAGSYSLKLGYGSEPARPKPVDLNERREAMTREFERLRVWSEKLRVRKRDLLNSDTEGAEAYNREATEFNAAVDKANSEKFALALLEK